jgi:Fanconi-associated nuclease 1
VSYETNKNKFNTLISWDSLRLNKKRLMEIGVVIGGNRLSKIIGNYCRDYKFWNHGMPDLILWDSKTGRVKFSEVKSETDRLSEVQKAWIAFFSQNGIDVEVCYVNRDKEDDEVE